MYYTIQFSFKQGIICPHATPGARGEMERAMVRMSERRMEGCARKRWTLLEKVFVIIINGRLNRKKVRTQFGFGDITRRLIINCATSAAIQLLMVWNSQGLFRSVKDTAL